MEYTTTKFVVDSSSCFSFRTRTLADTLTNRVRQLYKNISMLFLFPVKTVSLVQASIHNVSYISLQESKITLQNNMHK